MIARQIAAAQNQRAHIFRPPHRQSNRLSLNRLHCRACHVNRDCIPGENIVHRLGGTILDFGFRDLLNRVVAPAWHAPKDGDKDGDKNGHEDGHNNGPSRSRAGGRFSLGAIHLNQRHDIAGSPATMLRGL